MQVTVQLPDDLLQQFGDPASLPRQLLEALAAEAYRAQRLSRAQVSRLLGLDYWATERFLGEHDARRLYTLADLEIDRQSPSKGRDSN
jgi:hypothetical protein